MHTAMIPSARTINKMIILGSKLLSSSPPQQHPICGNNYTSQVFVSSYCFRQQTRYIYRSWIYGLKAGSSEVLCGLELTWQSRTFYSLFILKTHRVVCSPISWVLSWEHGIDTRYWIEITSSMKATEKEKLGPNKHGRKSLGKDTTYEVC